MKKIILSVISVFVVVILACGCNKAVAKNGWTVIDKANGTVDKIEYFVVLNIGENKGGAVIKENAIYICADGFTDDVKINFAFSNSSSITSKKEISTTMSRSSVKDGDGWHNVSELENSISYTYVEISTTDSMNFNEIVILNESGERLKLQFIKYGERSQKNKSQVFKELTKSQLEALNDEHGALNIIDEQESFKK